MTKPDTPTAATAASESEGSGLAFPARVTAYAPSGNTHACLKHARQLENLYARMFGMRLRFSNAPEGSQCDNCVNEAKIGKAA